MNVRLPPLEGAVVGIAGSDLYLVIWRGRALRTRYTMTQAFVTLDRLERGIIQPEYAE